MAALDRSLLVVIVDVNPAMWTAEAAGEHAPFVPIIRHLCMFINAFRALDGGNRLAIVACHAGKPTMLIRADEELDRSLHTVLDTALVLVLLATPDDPAQYNSVMNCIFAAQRAAIMIDCFAIRTSSTFMQQAAHMTGGVYVEPTAQQELGLAQLLITLALPDRACRALLRQPKAHDVDFRAACFLTNQLLDRAYVCSVCLSIFHHGDIIECPACRSRFPPPPRLARKRAKRAVAPAHGGPVIGGAHAAAAGAGSSAPRPAL
ncbi:hypothetical protein KFE25_006271 [Diacronema lutheri]|uniref:RNA polymerase II transcription factor B subunit 4 n=1 Tax=Diacronema lutheri TaxID=2081491 RepID=A0A8J5XVL1_DIALT|nr:hypothetical protein KFE25_006271 [Diacronema lutheri]